MKKRRNKPGPKPKVRAEAPPPPKADPELVAIKEEFELDQTDNALIFYLMRYPGVTDEQLGKLVGLARPNVNRRRNAPKFKRQLEAMNRSALQLVENSVKTAAEKYVSLLDSPDDSVKERVAKSILVSAGILKQKVEVDGDFWEPFVVQGSDGTKTVMGVREKVQAPVVPPVN